ncbi:hypothetical protein [Bradyrhizobium sp. CCBAU 11434]|uniref:hypothetical protein n=1 Tax=Bradyrhizobium sp. CCBAU 11434 TaxID=1630885 RepID=UPI0023069E5B|nr:hypothetical protein [Bradyrhizobium sp. CCBAU 11434]
MKSFASEIAKLEAAIYAKIRPTPDFAEPAEIIESVPGFAEGAPQISSQACQSLARCEIAAALIGELPMMMRAESDEASVTSRGPPLDPQCHLHALCRRATLNNPVLKDYYRRLLAKGTEPKVTVVACMRKLIT